jgi:hypothetical protein
MTGRSSRSNSNSVPPRAPPPFPPPAVRAQPRPAFLQELEPPRLSAQDGIASLYAARLCRHKTFTLFNTLFLAAVHSKPASLSIPPPAACARPTTSRRASRTTTSRSTTVQKITLSPSLPLPAPLFKTPPPPPATRRQAPAGAFAHLPRVCVARRCGRDSLQRAARVPQLPEAKRQV